MWLSRKVREAVKKANEEDRERREAATKQARERYYAMLEREKQYRRGRLTPEEEEEKRQEADATPDRWLNERCELDFRTTAKASALYHNYAEWMEGKGQKPMSQTRWGEWMTARYGKTKSNGCIYYDGLRLCPVADPH